MLTHFYLSRDSCCLLSFPVPLQRPAMLALNVGKKVGVGVGVGVYPLNFLSLLILIDVFYVRVVFVCGSSKQIAPTWYWWWHYLMHTMSVCRVCKETKATSVCVKFGKTNKINATLVLLPLQMIPCEIWCWFMSPWKKRCIPFNTRHWWQLLSFVHLPVRAYCVMYLGVEVK